MGNVFQKKPLKEVIRENQRAIKKSIRELDRIIKEQEKNETKLIADIKKGASKNQMGAIRVMAKDLVRVRSYQTKFITMKTHLNAISLKMQTVKSHQAMSDAMKGVTVALGKMNKQINMPELNKIMEDFMRENAESELKEEMIGDAIDDALAEDDTEEQEDMIVNQVMEELGISLAESVPIAPTDNKNENKEGNSTMSDIEARLQNLS